MGKMTFCTTFPFRTPKSEGVRNGLHDGKQDVRKGWYETSFTQIMCQCNKIKTLCFLSNRKKFGLNLLLDVIKCFYTVIMIYEALCQLVSLL